MKKAATLFLAITFFFAAFHKADAATMNDYCNQPPFLSTPVKPNVLILMDFSGSMQFPAYLPCSFGGYNGHVAMCGSASSGGNYDATKSYYGYFKTDKYYKYQSNTFQENSTCTDTNKIGSSNNCISGNLLNWITGTRVDVVRRVLNGGRNNAGKLESEGATYNYTDSNLHCKFTITATVTSNRKLTVENSGGTCPIGTMSNSTINLNDTSATGIVQDMYDKMTFEFMVFASDSREGILRSAKDATQSSLLSAISNEEPYYGTPTGEGLWEAYDFFKQSNDHFYESNTSDINAANGNKDPWYDGSGANSTAIPCRKSFVLLLSDGAWNGSVDPVTPARNMLVNDLRSEAALTGKQNVITYAVYAFGDLDPGTKAQGRQAMITTAIFGGFDDNDSNTWPYPFTGYPSSSLSVTYPRSQCNPSGTWDSKCSEWDKNKTGLPYNFFEADDGEALKTAIISAFNDMLRRASSGTAVSVLSSSEGSGANLMQAVFYPKRKFDSNTEIDWSSTMQNLWYYLDPYLQNTSTREDTTVDSKLNLTNDYVIKFYFDTNDSKTKAKRYSDSNGDGVVTDPTDLVDTIGLDSIKNLWEAGQLLWSRPGARTLYTYDIPGTSATNLMSFTTANESTLRSYLQAADVTEGTKIINYVLGTDQSGYRSRTVTIGSSSYVWKLGDIINSTPRIQGSARLNSYNLDSPLGYGDTTYSTFVNSNDYKNRGMVYVGANDGMLHAFYLGKLEEKWTGQTASEKAKLSDPDSTGLGKELWAYVPKNALPYLKYIADPNYCHLYFIDGPSYVFDASIAVPSTYSGNYWDAAKSTTVDGSNNLTLNSTSWRTILIGSMGLGGACRKTGDTCTNCVKTPTTDPADSTKGLGYSSYFALDVTNPASPTLLWEFSDPALGYATSGPAIVRIGNRDKNGRWFAVFASGPTGPIDTTAHQFMGKSDQNLKLFVVDLKTGTLLRTIDTGITNAFGGSLLNSPIDADKWNPSADGFYNDDVFYLGYAKLSGTTWTDGGVLRVVTKEGDPNNGASNWTTSTVIDGIGPVTTYIAKLQDRTNHKLWLHFGTGRYFYKTSTEIDDADSQRRLFGIKEPCYNKNGAGDKFDSTCSSADSLSFSQLTDKTSSPSSTEPDKGWYISLDASSGSYKAERVITDPLASFSGTVYFTTYSPTTDVCGFGGNTFLWAVKYTSGAQSANQQGKAMLQVSTGSIEEKSLSSSFTDKDNRRTSAITGTPPKGQGLSIVISPKPMKKIFHIKEK